jgi:multisubunit Na+/H+ antiporter MnhB subunit
MLWDHQRKVLLIKNNLYKPPVFDFQTFSLLCGLLLGILGTVLTVFLVVAVEPGFALLGGLIPFAVGLALLIFYLVVIQKAKEPHDKEMP